MSAYTPAQVAALLRRGLITIDDSGYVTLTDAGRQAVKG